jgi:thiol-disulfide isomerase/thioredoxin
MEKKVKSGNSIQKILNLIIVFLVVVLLLFVGYYMYVKNRSTPSTFQSTSVTKAEKPKKRSLFPAMETTFNFKTVDGDYIEMRASEKKMEIVGLQDKLIFLKIFGWDCQYCIKEIPQLVNLKKDLGDTFEVIAIEAQQHTYEESLAYINQYGINYSVVEGLHQQKFYQYLKTYYGWSGMIPLTIVLGKGGRILAYEVGAKSYTLAELMKTSLTLDKKR